MEKLEGMSLDLTKLNIEKLKELFPMIDVDGKIDFDMLRTILGDEVDDSREKYQFTWNGKTDSIRLAQSPSSATLRPCKEESKDWDTTENLYIEGDNLEVLKQLQKTYYGKVKMIYIDPPYNTGNDFIYKDDFKNSIANYKEQTEQGMSSNPETNGRYHTDWLNMMYPRLVLARNLLSEDGVIFISIDDTEVSNLKKICDEIFGQKNFISNIIWQKKFARQNDATYFSTMHDNILCYAKLKKENKNDTNGFNMNLLPRTEEDNINYKNPDNDPRGPWISVDFSAKSGTEKLRYEIETPAGMKYIPAQGRYWSTSKEGLKKLIDDNRMWFGRDGKNRPRLKTFLSEVQNGMTPNSIWFYNEVSHTQASKQNLKKLFDGKSIFDTPKPVELVYRIIYLSTNKDDIILDFFSGSSTTAHSVMKINAEDKGNRKFIMVQLPEEIDNNTESYKNGYKNICEIGKERIRRAGELIKQEYQKSNPDKKFTTDIGFKVFKLDSTNIKPWENTNKLDIEQLSYLEEVFKKDRSKEDILYEILLKYGLFDMPVSEVDINGKTMYRVGRRYMIVCLEDNINASDIKEIIELSPRVVVFKESGFNNDNDKINAEYNLKKAGIEEIKCI